jgi:FAD/FMN-containing dehydrogenase
VSGTGVGGLTLGGGSGWLERKIGYAVDNLVAAEVVLGDGRVIRATERDHADLFWGLRGGGGNFGVVTSFEFRLHPVGPIVLGGMLLFPGFRGREVLETYRDLMDGAPDELGGAVAFMTAPPADFVPEAARGKLACGLVLVWSGDDPAAGEAVIAPLRELGPAVDLVQPMPYTVVQTLVDAGNPDGLRNYWKGEFLRELDAEGIDALVTAAERKPSPHTQLLVVPGGGAVGRVAEDATAAGQRGAPWNIHILSMWEDAGEDEANLRWTRATAAALDPWKTGRAFLNFNSEGEDFTVREALGEDTFGRLRRLKGEYDPKAMFQANYGIPPAA